MAVNRDKEADLEKLADAFFKDLKFIKAPSLWGPGIDTCAFDSTLGLMRYILETIGWDMIVDDPGYGTHRSSTESLEQHEYAWNLYTEKLVPYMKKQWEELKTLKAKNTDSQ